MLTPITEKALVNLDTLAKDVFSELEKDTLNTYDPAPILAMRYRVRGAIRALEGSYHCALTRELCACMRSADQALDKASMHIADAWPGEHSLTLNAEYVIACLAEAGAHLAQVMALAVAAVNGGEYAK